MRCACLVGVTTASRYRVDSEATGAMQSGTSRLAPSRIRTVVQRRGSVVGMSHAVV